MHAPPDNAEKHLLSDYTALLPRPSGVIPGEKFYVAVFDCPRCGYEATRPQHGLPGRCGNCDLQWIAHGNALYLWVEEPPTL